MTSARLLYLPILLLLALWSCREDKEVFEPYPASAQEISALLEQQVPAASTYSVFSLSNLTDDQVLETSRGTRIFLVDTDHLFSDANTGSPVLCSTCNDLKIEVTEVADPSDIVARGLSTVSDAGTLFQSGGMVKVTVQCNGKTLALLPDRTLKVQLPNNDAQNDYFVFSKTNAAAWTMSAQPVFKADWITTGGQTLSGYELLLKTLGWSAAGQMMTDPASTFCIELPTGFGGENTLAYLVFKNQTLAVPLQFDLGKNTFCHDNIPIGYQVQLMAVSKLGDQYWLGKAGTEIGTSATLQLGSQQQTEEGVVNFVKGL